MKPDDEEKPVKLGVITPLNTRELKFPLYDRTPASHPAIPLTLIKERLFEDSKPESEEDSKPKPLDIWSVEL